LSGEPIEDIMMDFSDKSKRWLKKMKKRDRAKFDQISRKLEDIHKDPGIGDPKKYHLRGVRGVHVDCFVILYEWSEADRTIEVLKIVHHDDAYR